MEKARLVNKARLGWGFLWGMSVFTAREFCLLGSGEGPATPCWLANIASLPHIWDLLPCFMRPSCHQMPVHLQKGLGWGLGFELCVWGVILTFCYDLLISSPKQRRRPSWIPSFSETSCPHPWGATTGTQAPWRLLHVVKLWSGLSFGGLFPSPIIR